MQNLCLTSIWSAGQRYLISSKNFSPSAFLRDVHADTSEADLRKGLNFLSTSIAKKSESLKVLVESNFDRFVAAKATIDGVYKEMSDKRFFSKETEYSVGEIRGSLNEAGVKADEVFGPVMAGRGREEALRLLLQKLEQHRDMLSMPRVIADCVQRKDHVAVLEEYQKARTMVAESRKLVPNPAAGVGNGVKEDHIHQLVIAEKMWVEVENIIEAFKKDTWGRLVECKAEDSAHMDLIGILLELGVDESPIVIWLQYQHTKILERIQTRFQAQRVDIEGENSFLANCRLSLIFGAVARRKVMNSPPPRPHIIGQLLRAPSRRIAVEGVKTLDTAPVMHFWETLEASFQSMLSPTTGILGELLSFWKSAQSFIDGDNMLPVGIDDRSKKFHRLSDEDVRVLKSCTLELVNSIRESMVSFFQDPPPEDVSHVYTPPSPMSATFPHSPAFPRMVGQTPDLENEVFSFYPPTGNSLGGAFYLSKISTLLGNAATLLTENLAREFTSNITESLRSMLNSSRDRMITALTAAWIRDSAHARLMEDWNRSPSDRGITKFPAYFLKWETEVIASLQTMVYLDKVRNAESTNVIPPPPLKLITLVRGHFVRTIFKALHGMVENSQSTTADAPEFTITDRNGLSSPLLPATPTNLTANSINAEDRNVRMLLTLSNLASIRSSEIETLISNFEAAFSVKLTDETNTIHSTMDQVKSNLFAEYTKPIVASLHEIVQAGVLSPDWPPPRGRNATEVRSYVYDAMLKLVDVHAQVMTTSPAMVQPVVSHLLERLCYELVQGFKGREKYELGELLQATLDTEFVFQSLDSYISPEAKNRQTELYGVLDKRATADAKSRLQNELAECKSILSRVRRYSRAEFACFRDKKKERGRTKAGSSSRGSE